MKSPASDAALPDLVTAVRARGFLRAGERTLVMLSGGGDSVALIAVAATACAPSAVVALHVNYGLRGADSDADEQLCRELCEQLGVELLVERVTLGAGGNLHDRARKARYRLAQAAAERLGCGAIAVAHNADDRAETLLYRLAASPGRRALLGMPRRRGLIVRPLLDFTGEQLRAWCRAEGLAWREDTANVDPRFARTRVRRALAELRSVHPAAVANILRTADELGAEADVLDAVVEGLLDGACGADGLRAGELAAMPAPLAALVLREFTERALGTQVPAARGALRRVLDAAAAGGSRAIDVEGARLVLEYGILTAHTHGATTPVAGQAGETVAGELPAVDLPVPGIVRFGDWRIEASANGAPAEGSQTAESVGMPSALARDLTVRARRPGDRMHPLGLGGSKLLQDLFVDHKIPRRLRDAYPLICVDGGEQILWVPGVAVAQACGPRPRDGGAWITAARE